MSDLTMGGADTLRRDPSAPPWRAVMKWLDRPFASFHLVVALLVLMLGFGLTMVLSSSAATAFREQDSAFAVFANQAMFAALGLIAFVLVMRLPISVIRSASTAAVIVSTLLLVLVLVPGIGMRVNGARSWMPLPAGLSFQPSEVAKLALLLWAAHVMASTRGPQRRWRNLLIPVGPVVMTMVLLIMGQPDLGTTVTLAIVFFAVLYFAGAPLWIFGGMAAAGVAGVWVLAHSAGYRVERITAWLYPEIADPQSTYQSFQGLYAMGSGGVFGVGIGQSKMKWGRLPMAESDFIFAIIGEELGLIGAVTVIVLFALLAYVGLRIARRNVDPFVKICAAAGTTWLVGQAAINIGYVVGLFPVTGIPLPMFSRGGTSLIVTIVVFGLLANFARREPQAMAALAGGERRGLAAFLGLGRSRMAAMSKPGGLSVARRRSPRAAQRAERRAKRVRQERASVRVARPAGSSAGGRGERHPRQQAGDRRVAARPARPSATSRTGTRKSASRRHPIRRALGFPVPGEGGRRAGEAAPSRGRTVVRP